MTAFLIVTVAYDLLTLFFLLGVVAHGKAAESVIQIAEVVGQGFILWWAYKGIQTHDTAMLMIVGAAELYYFMCFVQGISQGSIFKMLFGLVSMAYYIWALVTVLGL